MCRRLASAQETGRGYDSNWFRQALAERGIELRIPSTRTRKAPLAYEKAPYRQRHKIENLFAKLSQHATTDAPIPSSQPFASRQPSHAIPINESRAWRGSIAGTVRRASLGATPMMRLKARLKEASDS